MCYPSPPPKKKIVYPKPTKKTLFLVPKLFQIKPIFRTQKENFNEYELFKDMSAGKGHITC